MKPPPQALDRRDFASAGELLAEAFFDNPAHVYIFPAEERRRRALGWLLERNLAVQAPLEHSFCIVREQAGARRIDAMGFWHVPGAASAGPLQLLRRGFLPVPFRCGLESTQRLVELTGALAEARRDALGSTPAWYLNNMAVSKTLRGSGLGTELLAGELGRRIDPSGQPAALATQRPENVEFYRRLGFEVASDRMLGSRSHAFRNWIMLREPVAPAV